MLCITKEELGKEREEKMGGERELKILHFN
jgi:hypothetical protein